MKLISATLLLVGISSAHAAPPEQPVIPDSKDVNFQDFAEQKPVAAEATPSPETSTASSAMDPEPDRLPSSKSVDEDLNALNTARASGDETAVVAAATRILGGDSKNLRALNALAIYYHSQNKLGMAKILIQRALVDHPTSATLHNNIGVVYLSEGKQRQALTAFRKAGELQKNYPFAAANLGSIFLEYHDYKRAAETLASGYEAVKSSLSRGKNFGMNVASNYAQALSGAGDFDHAKSVFQKLIKVDDQNVATLFNYAVLLVARMKNKSEGEKILAKLKGRDTDANMQKHVEDLEKMLSGT
jgi:Flp pilus assembly protein TadD